MNFSNVTLDNLSIHIVGNKIQEKNAQLSKNQLQLTEAISPTLNFYFITPFQKLFKYEHFYHPSNLKHNTCYNIIRDIFIDKKNFHELSIELANYLFDISDNHFIKKGEFYVGYFRGFELDGKIMDAIGLFKSESRERFIKVYPENKGFHVEIDEGIDINKLDKGALIFNQDKANGFKILTIDQTNKSQEAQYWKDNFLKVTSVNDDNYQTENYISFSRDFIMNKLAGEVSITKPEQIDLLNKSAAYFQERETFDIQEFSSIVISKKKYSELFGEYKDQYEFLHDVQLENSFQISQRAVKRNLKNFKSVLKLDKNFHVYIHGDKKLIEKGYDQQSGKKYYKLFFDEEY